MRGGYVGNLKYFRKCGGEGVCKVGDFVFVVTPHSDTDEGFGAGGANEKTAMDVGKFGIVFKKKLVDHFGGLEILLLFGGGGEIDHDLREFGYNAGEVF